MSGAQHQLPHNTAALGTSFGIGVLWVFMAFTSLWSAVRGLLNQRYDWALVWGLVGLLLFAAGLAAMIGTWLHLTRSHDDY